MKVPTISQAELILKEAEVLNPGPWVAHNKVAGACDKAIAEKCDSLDSDSAYILGILHDIGRKFGVTDMHHILDGYNFMKEQGFDDSARICLTHSFPYKNIASYSGENDCSTEETEWICKFLQETQYDDYDKLIQLCDALAYPTGPVYMEKRLVDVVMRRGLNNLTVTKWKAFFTLKDYFDKKINLNIYNLLEVK